MAARPALRGLALAISLLLGSIEPLVAQDPPKAGALVGFGNANSFLNLAGDERTDPPGYGPGVALGYQFTGDSGRTFTVTGGVALDGLNDGLGSAVIRPTIGVSAGRTWR